MKRINPILLVLLCSISAFSGEISANSGKQLSVISPPDSAVVVGMSWNELANRSMVSISKRNLGPGTMSGRVTAIAVPRKSPYQQLNRNTIYAGTASGGIWKSSNGGISWDPIFDDMDVQSIGALAVDPNNASVVWAGTGKVILEILITAARVFTRVWMGVKPGCVWDWKKPARFTELL